MKLSDKIALVTGGTHGIGEAIVRRFVAEGARVAATYHADEVKAEALEAEFGDAVKTFKADCSLVTEIDSMMGSVMETFGGVDILVNNSGTITFAPVEETTEAIWDEQVDLNLKGPFFLVKAVLPSFRSRGGGKVINIGSIAGVGGVPNCAGYQQLRLQRRPDQSNQSARSGARKRKHQRQPSRTGQCCNTSERTHARTRTYGLAPRPHCIRPRLSRRRRDDRHGCVSGLRRLQRHPWRDHYGRWRLDDLVAGRSATMLFLGTDRPRLISERSGLPGQSAPTPGAPTRSQGRST